MSNNIYETNKSISQYCEFHYGDEYFKVKNFPKKSVDLLHPFLKNIEANKALDLGCAVGRSSFELADYFQEVIALDYSNNFIEVAKKLQDTNEFTYDIVVEGNISEKKSFSLDRFGLSKNKNKITFMQGDAQRLDISLSSFDLIFCSNLIDRLEDPNKFLKDIQSRLNINGLLVILSPYTWLEEYTPKSKWLGGYRKENRDIFTIDTLKKGLYSLKLLDTMDVEFVIKETKRKFQHSISQMSIWKK